MLKYYEGERLAPYNDGRGNWTIGVGHRIKNKECNKITFSQSAKFLYDDINICLKRIRFKIPKFDFYPDYVRLALLNSFFRGDTGQKTIALINDNKWILASIEYLNRYDYKNAVKLEIGGIKRRMEVNRNIFLFYGIIDKILRFSRNAINKTP